VCIKANDHTQGDSNNQVTAVVVQGTPAVSPVVPTIPAGAVAVATMRMPAGATATNSAIVMAQPDYAIPYGAGLGRIVSYRNTYDGQASDDSTWFVENTSSISLPSRRLLEFRYARCMNSIDANNLGSILVEFQLDGTGIVQTEMLASTKWETHQFSYLIEIQPGVHSVSVRNRHQSGGSIYYRYDPSSTTAASQLAGMTFDVIDRGGIN